MCLKHRISSVTPLLPGNSLPSTDTHETSEARVSWLPRHDSRILLDQDPFKTSRNAIKVKVHEIKNTSNIIINTCSIISSSLFQVSLPLSQYFSFFNIKNICLHFATSVKITVTSANRWRVGVHFSKQSCWWQNDFSHWRFLECFQPLNCKN